MTTVSVAGVAIGVASLIIVLSVMGGFEHDLHTRMFKGLPHIEMGPQKVGVPISLNQTPVKVIESADPRIVAVEAFTQVDVVIKQNRHMSSAVLFGIDPDRKGHLWGFGQSLTEGDFGSLGKSHRPGYSDTSDKTMRPGIFLGEQLALQLGADMGDEITVLSPRANVGSVLGGGTLSRKYVVAGKFLTGSFNYDARWAVVSMSEGRKFLADYDASFDQDNMVSGIALNVIDPYDVDGPAAKVEAAAPLIAKTWKLANKSLLFALKLEKFSMGSVLMLIVLVAAFSISGTMMMTVFHKRNQVSVLRAIGMPERSIAQLFLYLGGVIGGVGTLVGLVLGLLACVWLDRFGGVSLPNGAYYLKSLPIKYLPGDYGVISGFAVALALLAALYPALTASRQDPAAGLRYE